jgi:hypothetical protein
MAIATINITGEKTTRAIAAHNLSNTHLIIWLSFWEFTGLLSCGMCEFDFMDSDL